MKKLYIETYGCQMNVADSEVVASIMKDNNYALTGDLEQADAVFVNTCSIRENAEQRVFGRLDVFRLAKQKNDKLVVGVIGCMAERLKNKLLETKPFVDLVVGPDAYRNLPSLLSEIEKGQKAIDVKLSREETYDNICPLRYSDNKVSTFVSIMRGCDNMCSYCVVPFTRGRERSRKPETIIKEANDVLKNGYKEVTILGQNVDKYFWEPDKTTFAQLLERVAGLSPDLRVRFATSYPQDMTDEVLKTMAEYKNICNYIHLPVQSGSTKILKAMRRGYTCDEYLERINAIKKYVPDCGISTDFITGFCGETEEDHQQTLSLMKEVKYDFAYMFKYSERPNTYAQRRLDDDVPEKVKIQRLNEVIALQQEHSRQSNENDIGKTFEVLAEGVSKKSNDRLFGRNSQNKVVVFPAKNYAAGDYVNVKIESCTSATLLGSVAK